MFIRSIRSIAAVACVLSLVACAGSDPSESVATGDQAATSGEVSCGASYAIANQHYKNAVAAAKLHQVNACGADGEISADVVYISDEAMRAVTSCAAFSDVIKTSPYAAPIREELADNLILPVLTGELKVDDASGTFDGLNASLAKGVTLWATGGGAYGSPGSLTFGEDGTVTVARQEWPAGADEPRWQYMEGTYEIGTASEGIISIVVHVGDSSTEYEMSVLTWEGRVHDFQLRAAGTPHDTMPAFTAFISECDA